MAKAVGKMRLEGLDELDRNLRTLGDRVHRRVMKIAVRAGAKPIIQAARKNVTKGRGDWQTTKALRKSLGVKVGMSKRSPTTYAVIGARAGHGVTLPDGRKHNPMMIAHLVEFGHGGPHAAPPHPFLRPAFDGQVGAARHAMANKIRQGIEKEAAKAAKK